MGDFEFKSKLVPFNKNMSLQTEKIPCIDNDLE